MDLTAIILAIIGGVLGGTFLRDIVTLRSTKKKEEKEVTTVELQNEKTGIEIYREMNNDLYNKLQATTEKLDKAVIEIGELTKKLTKLEQQCHNCKLRNE